MEHDELYEALKAIGKNKTWLANELGVSPRAVWGWRNNNRGDKYQLALRWVRAEIKLREYNRIKESLEKLT